MNDLGLFAFRTSPPESRLCVDSYCVDRTGDWRSSTVFAIADGLLFCPLPVPNASEVLTLSSSTPSGSAGDVSYPDFLDFRRLNPSFSGLFAARMGLQFMFIGVAHESFTSVDQFFHPSFFVPAAMAPSLAKADVDLLTNRANRAFHVEGRIKPGVSLSTANGEARVLAH